MVTIQFQLRSHELSDMSADERVAYLDDIARKAEAAAKRGEVYAPEGPENPFPEWLRHEIAWLQGWIWLRRALCRVLALFQVKYVVTRELKWDRDNQVYKLTNVPDHRAEYIRELFYHHCTEAMKRDESKAEELRRDKLEIKATLLENSLEALAVDADLWANDEPPPDRERILANMFGPQPGAPKE